MEDDFFGLDYTKIFKFNVYMLFEKSITICTTLTWAKSEKKFCTRVNHYNVWGRNHFKTGIYRKSLKHT